LPPHFVFHPYNTRPERGKTYSAQLRGLVR
jgi:hypothetical protein